MISSSIGISTPVPFEASGMEGVPRLGRITPEWHRARAALLYPVGHNCTEIYVDGMEVGVARNQAAKTALESGMKYLFFLDWDTIPPRDALCRLVYHLDNHPDYDVAAGMYCSKSMPPFPLLWREWGKGVSWDWTLGEVLTEGVVGVPAGCTLYRVSVFGRLPFTEATPWFRTDKGTIDPGDGSGEVPFSRTEDLWFCMRLDKELHGRILVDTGIQCDHIDHATGVRFCLPDDCLPRFRAKEAADKRRTVLHIGCGPRGSGVLPPELQGEQWREIRVDVDPAVQPDVVASMTDLRRFTDSSIDAVYSWHNVEHLHSFDVPIALKEFYRVVKPGGLAIIGVPDIQAVAAEVAGGNLEGALYESPAGPISAIDILYGHRGMSQGNQFQHHRTAFTRESLQRALEAAGFMVVEIQQTLDKWGLAAYATKK